MNNLIDLPNYFEPYILKCRPGDWEHAKRVVSWIKELSGRREDLKTSPDHIKEKYALSDWLSICDLFEKKFPQRIKTETGKQLFSKKLAELRKTLEAELSM